MPDTREKQGMLWNDLRQSKRLQSSTLPPECLEILNGVASASAGLTACMLRNSQPWFTSCLSCKPYHSQLEEFYRRVFVAEQSLGNASCHDIFFYGSKLNLLENAYKNAIQMWVVPECFACYKCQNCDETNEVTRKFYDFYTEYLGCRQKHIHNMTRLCRSCRETYKTTRDYFEASFKQHGVCMDVLDTWNKTQREWSTHFRCRHHHTDPFLLGAFASVIFASPLVFYISVYLNSDAKVQTFERMKRISGEPIFSDDETLPGEEMWMKLSNDYDLPINNIH